MSDAAPRKRAILLGLAAAILILMTVAALQGPPTADEGSSASNSLSEAPATAVAESTPQATPFSASPMESPTPQATPTSEPTTTPRPVPPPTPAPTPPPPPAAVWRVVLSQQFNAASELNQWTLYDGPYGSGPHNCATPSHVSVSGGVLRLLMRHETSGRCGAGWYTGGMMVREPYGGVDQRVTIRFRIVSNGVSSHHNLPLRWPTQVPWPAGGEENYCEGSESARCWVFLHFGANNSQVDGNYAVDLTQWHTFRFERRALIVRIFVDDMSAPVWMYQGTALTLPETFKRVVLQQECANPCPSGSVGSEEIQVDWIAIENPG